MFTLGHIYFPVFLVLYLAVGFTLVSYVGRWGFPGSSAVKTLPTMQETVVRSLGQEDPLEEDMGTHSSTLTWRIHGQRSLAGCIS